MSSRVSRITVYLQAMFPPLVLLPASAASFLALHLALQALGDPSIVERPLGFSWRMLAGILSLFLFQLLLRVYDELKDAETDIRLGKAGDPRYADRPIVTGAITVEDLDALRRWVIASLFLLNLFLGYPLPLFAFLAVFFLCWLSFKWFFWPAISKNLLLAFATHNPLSLAIGLYVVALYVAEVPGHRPFGGWLWLLLVGLWLPVAAWEIGRKVRLPADETDYDTYSKRLGWGVAGALPGILAAASSLCICAVLRHLGFGLGAQLWVWACAALPVIASARFLLAPSTERAKLQPVVEVFMLLLNVGLAVSLAAGYGMRMGI
jgi:hypothetical protein